MESKKREDDIRSILGEDFGKALRGCQMSARGFFVELLPMLQTARPYGHLFLTADELSVHFGVSLHMTRCYLRELKQHRVLKEGKDGDIYCPILIRQMVRRLMVK